MCNRLHPPSLRSPQSLSLNSMNYINKVVYLVQLIVNSCQCTNYHKSFAKLLCRKLRAQINGCRHRPRFSTIQQDRNDRTTYTSSLNLIFQLPTQSKIAPLDRNDSVLDPKTEMLFLR